MKIKDFYANKRVLITGHSGFIGSWLTKWLTMMNTEVCGFSLDPPTVPNMYDIVNLRNSIMDIRGDIRNAESLQNVIREFKPEIVFHLAAQPIVLESYDNPVETFDVNVTGTANILNSLRNSDSVRTIIVVTSDKSYLNNGQFYPYRESDALGGKDPYSASKSCQDIVVNSFRESFFSDIGVGISAVRAGNVIGGGDFAKYRIIPDIVRAISESNTVIIRNPDSVRPWQHVLEPSSGVLSLAEKMYKDISFSGAWNFGPDPQSVRTVRELTETFIGYYGQGEFITQTNKSLKEATYLQIDISKANKELGWKPCYDFDKTVKTAVEWYRAYLEGSKDLDEITKKQINEYAGCLS